MTIERAQLASSFYLIDTISYISNAMQGLAGESACAGDAAADCSAVWEGDAPEENIPDFLNPYLSGRNLTALRRALPSLPSGRRLSVEDVEQAYLNDPTSNQDLRAVVAIIAASSLPAADQANIIAALYLIDVISYIANAMEQLSAAPECTGFEDTCTSVWEGDNLDGEDGNIATRMTPDANARTLQRLFALAADPNQPLQQRFESRYLADPTSTVDLETALCRLRSEGTNLCIDSRIQVTTDPAEVRQGEPVTITITAQEGLIFPADVAVEFIPSEGINSPAEGAAMERSADGRTLTLRRTIAADAALDDATTPDVRENLRMVQISSPSDRDFAPIVSDAFVIQQGYPAQCRDSVDNDGDGQIDSADTADCAIGGPGEQTVEPPAPEPEPTTPATCEGGEDEDLDGYADGNDLDCQEGQGGSAAVGEQPASPGARAGWRALHQLGARAMASFGGMIPIGGLTPLQLSSAWLNESPSIGIDAEVGREDNPATFWGSRIFDIIGHGRLRFNWGGQPEQHGSYDSTTTAFDAAAGIRLHTPGEPRDLAARDRFFAELLFDYSLDYNDRAVANQFYWNGTGNTIGGEATLGSNFGTNWLTAAVFGRVTQEWRDADVSSPSYGVNLSRAALERFGWAVGGWLVIDGPALHPDSPERFPTTVIEGYYSEGQIDEPQFDGRRSSMATEPIEAWEIAFRMIWDHNAWLPSFRAAVRVEERGEHARMVTVSGEASVDNDESLGRIAIGGEHTWNEASPTGDGSERTRAYMQYTPAPWVPRLDALSLIVSYSNLREGDGSSARGIDILAVVDVMRLIFRSPDRSHRTDWDIPHHQDALEDFSERPARLRRDDDEMAESAPQVREVQVSPSGVAPAPTAVAHDEEVAPPPPPEPEEGTGEAPPVAPPAGEGRLITWTPTREWQFDSSEPDWNIRDDGYNPEDIFLSTFDGNNLSFENGELVLGIDVEGCPAQCDGRSYASAEYRTNDENYLYGFYETRMRAARGAGVLSTFFLYSGTWRTSSHSEIDFEFAGRCDAVDVNFYAGTDGEDNSHSRRINLGFDACTEFHNYGFMFSEDRLVFYVDGQPRETFLASEGPLPNRGTRIMLNTWLLNPDNAGLVSWAGTPNPSELPTSARYDWVRFAELDSQPE